MIITDNGSSMRIRGIGPMEDFKATPIFKTIMVSGNSSGVQFIQDAQVSGATAATTQTLYDISYGQPLGTLYGARQNTITSLTPSVVTVDSTGVTTYVSNGTGIISVSVPNMGTKQITFPVSQQTNQSSLSFIRFASGSLGEHLTVTMSGYISGKIAGASTKNIYSSIDNTSFSYVRNTGIFTGTLDLTCIPAWNTSNGVNFMGLLVTPRHIISCAHATLTVGAAVFFVTNNNVTVSGIINNRAQVGTTDIIVYSFSSALPSSITPAAILPSGYLHSLPQPNYAYPGLFRLQGQTVNIGDMNSWQNGNGVTVSKSTDSSRSLWYGPVVNGDSGSPAFFIVNSGVVAVTQWTSSNFVNSAGGPSDGDNVASINSVIATLASGYSLTQANLSGFNSY